MVLLNGSANRDERRFPDRDRFDIHRDDRPAPAFGYGIHFCLGMALARLEGRVALDEVLNRFPELGGRLRRGPAGPDLDGAGLGDAAGAHVVTGGQRRGTHHAHGRHDPGQHRRPLIEPPDMYEHHVPAKYRDEHPKSSQRGGHRPVGLPGPGHVDPLRHVATVGWPRRNGGSTRATFSELRPGCFDVHERVRDMNVNGVLASMCFPTMAGFNARTFTEAGDKDLSS